MLHGVIVLLCNRCQVTVQSFGQLMHISTSHQPRVSMVTSQGGITSTFINLQTLIGVCVCVCVCACARVRVHMCVHVRGTGFVAGCGLVGIVCCAVVLH